MEGQRYSQNIQNVLDNVQQDVFVKHRYPCGNKVNIWKNL